jgi:hypothetical protein
VQRLPKEAGLSYFTEVGPHCQGRQGGVGAGSMGCCGEASPGDLRRLVITSLGKVLE